MISRLGLSCVVATMLLGCSDATGGLVGGDSLTSSSSSGSSSGGSDSGSGGSGFSPGLSADCMPGGANGGSTWSDLYACYFGPNAGAMVACAQTACHAGSGDLGTMASHYQCDPASKDSCFSSMTSVLVGSNTSSPPTTTLYQILRKTVPTPTSSCTVSGVFMCDSMPLTNYAFGSADIERVATWIQNGASNN